MVDECGTSLNSLQQYRERRGILTFLEDIRQSGQRAAEIVANMLSFSRKAEGKGSPADLGELLDRTVSLAASDYDLEKHYDFRRIEIMREYQPATPPVICQAGKLQLVFLNVLRNGARAMRITGWCLNRSLPPNLQDRVLVSVCRFLILSSPKTTGVPCRWNRARRPGLDSLFGCR
jgi:signal transduction histidine kinase